MSFLKFKASAPNDRKDAFEHLCNAHNLDIEKKAKDYGIDKNGPGKTYNVTIEKLFLFLYKEKFYGSFDFSENQILVQFEQKEVTGKQTTKTPEAIPDSEVDEEEDDDTELPF